MIKCMIIIYMLTPSGRLDEGLAQVNGKFLKQNGNSTHYQVDFQIGLKELKVSLSLNNTIQWVHHNWCLFDNKENR